MEDKDYYTEQNVFQKKKLVGKSIRKTVHKEKDKYENGSKRKSGGINDARNKRSGRSKTGVERKNVEQAYKKRRNE